MFRVLLMEDDAALFREIKEVLASWECKVFQPDFQNVMKTYAELEPDLVIIDIQLPKFDCFHWCRLIREHSNLPIIFLSSRDHPTDMVMSMNLGADDYIQKPFHFEVLTAKVHALLRRVYNYSRETPSLKTWAGAAVDLERNQVTYKDSTTETKNEMFILSLLLEKKNQIVTRETLIHACGRSFSQLLCRTLRLVLFRDRAVDADVYRYGYLHSSILDLRAFVGSLLQKSH
ncbi:response regulator [Alteribacillus sp. HJP-4]|uniref:response regulator n=1 Tax=Alteribacillus sp. HJP-4 TaxID=2775394 RepID=UPI0035CCDD53